jgi:thioredoxin-related protein
MTVALSAAANAAELLMYRTAGCPWCAKWDEAIGPIYPKTEVGRRAPLRVVHSDKENGPDVALSRPVRYSPTFVLVDNGREVGRIEGYPGEDFFWGLLENLVLKLPRREATIGAAAAR